MNWKDEIRRSLESADQSIDDDVVDELTQHVEALVQNGARDQEIHALVADWARAGRLVRPSRVRLAVTPPESDSRGLAGLALDFRYSGRVMRRQLGVAALAVATIALGVAATTTLFTVVNGVLLKPLPWPNADRLVRITEVNPTGTTPFGDVMTNGTYQALASGSSTLDTIGAWNGLTSTITTESGDLERLDTASVTGSLVAMLAIRPAVGRALTVDDETGPAVAMIAYGYWQSHFGGKNVVGRTLRMDGRSYQIVGVLPAGIAFPTRMTRVWVPFQVPPASEPGAKGVSVSLFNAVGRMRQGATTAAVAAEATALSNTANQSAMLLSLMGGGPLRVQAITIRDSLTRDVQPALLVLLAAVVLLFAAAIGNIASLQLARSTARRREMAIRAALGGSSRRLARQVIIENLVIGALGGLAGLAIAWLAAHELPHWLPADFPRLDDIALSGRVLVVSVIASVVASLTASVMPAWHVRRLGLVAILNDNGQSPVGVSLRVGVARARSIIMAAQMAISVVLLIGAALFARSFFALLEADRGYQPEHLLTSHLFFSSRTITPTQRTAFFESLVAELSRWPGVTNAAVTSKLPLTPGDGSHIFPMPAGYHANGFANIQVSDRPITTDYFVTMGIHVHDGRVFDEHDTADAEPVVVVNRTFARRYFNDHAVGVELPAGLVPGHDNWRIVGVIDDVRQKGVTDQVGPEMYIDFRQLGGSSSAGTYVVVRTSGDSGVLQASLERIVRSIEPSVIVEATETMEERVVTSLSKPRLYAAVLTAYGALSLMVAGVGLFGVLSYAVAQRVREIGVRAALGARPIDISRLVLRQALVVTVVGAAGGVVIALLVSRYVSALLYGVTTHDTPTFVAVPIILLLVAAIASYVPARRAARMDPLTAIRT